MNSLHHALAILELLEQSPGGLRNSEISRQLKIATSTCSVVTAQLANKGYLRRHEETGRYQIGLKTVALAHGALRELGFRSMAEPNPLRAGRGYRSLGRHRNVAARAGVTGGPR